MNRSVVPVAVDALDGLACCPSTPNCVSSDAEGHAHKVLPLQLSTIVTAGEAWQAVREFVSTLPRTRIINETDHYLHAECRSAMFGFVDDLELQLRPIEGVIAVRSAARLGYSDLGVNRRRVERLRRRLIARGVVI